MSRWDGRPSRHARGYGNAWDKLRLRILSRDEYLCQPCYREGRITAATSVDHIKPKAKGGTDDPTNLQSICTACRAEKDAIDRGRPLKPKRTTGVDGWTI